LRSNLVEEVADILRETGLPPALLNLELTESILVQDLDKTRGVLTALKKLGVGLKLDDFGTGFSSLNVLVGLPFDTIKIDRSFVLAMDDHRQDSIEMVRAIVHLAGSLKMGVIAEGIENPRNMPRAYWEWDVNSDRDSITRSPFQRMSH